MSKARTVILKGLIEVLVLDSLGAQPKHGYALIQELEETVGEYPGKSQIYTLLGNLEDEGLVASREEPGDGGRPRLVYALTDAGEQRLLEYRALPEPFRARLVRLWGDAAPIATATQQVDGGAEGPASNAWGARALARLPAGALTSCPHARVEIARDLRAGDWTIQIERADIGAHDGHDSCPVCFVVQAAVRLLLNPSVADR